MYGENMNDRNGYAETGGENLYGQPSGENIYGQPSGGNIYGQPSGGNPYGQPNGEDMYAQPNGQGTGQAVRAQAGPRHGANLEKMLDQFLFYGVGCIVYGILFTICLYPGLDGISVPVLSAVTMGALLAVFYRNGIQAGKSAPFYAVSAILLGVSSCLTGSGVLVAFNTIGMLFLTLGFLLTRFCHTDGWGFEEYIWRFCKAPFAAFVYWGCPFESLNRHLSKRERETGRMSKGKYIWIGAAISFPVVIIVLCLLASADAVFRRLLEVILESIRFPAHPFLMIFLLIAGSIGTYGLLACFVENRDEKEEVRRKRQGEPIVGIGFLSVLTAVYVLFCVIQISYLFLGSFALPEGYTYASYAREGFFQLLLVCLINLGIVLFCVSWFREHVALKALLTVFSGCTFIMDASSAMRMLLYVQAKQLTFLRVLVLWALVVIDILLVGCIITIYRNAFPLFQYVMTVVTVCYLFFSLLKPDYIIAKYNLSNKDKEPDYRYLCELSADAVPAMEEEGMLSRFEKGIPDDVFFMFPHFVWNIEERGKTGIRCFNFSNYRAVKILEKYDFSDKEEEDDDNGAEWTRRSAWESE